VQFRRHRNIARRVCLDLIVLLAIVPGPFDMLGSRKSVQQMLGKHDKFIAAQACDQVALAHGPQEALGDDKSDTALPGAAGRASVPRGSCADAAVLTTGSVLLLILRHLRHFRRASH